MSDDGAALDKQFGSLSVLDEGPPIDGFPEQSLPWLLGATSSPLEVWATSATDDVRNGPNKATWGGMQENSGGGIRLLAAKGERISFQIGVEPQRGISGLELSVTCRNLEATDCGRTWIPSAIPDEDSWRGHLWPEGDPRRQMPPDALIPVPWGARVSLADRKPLYLWVSIDIPSDQELGTYKTTISVSGHVTIMPAKQASEKLRETASRANAAMDSSDVEELHKILKEMMETSERVSKGLEHGSRMLIPENIDVVIKVMDVKRGSKEWQVLFDRYFRFLLQYRMSPYFCRWKARGEEMGLVTYTSPYPLRSKETEDLLSLPELAVYIAPIPGQNENKDDDPGNPTLDELQALIDSPHWNKAMFYLFDEPTNTEHYKKLEEWAKPLLHEAPDARILTTYYCGPKDLETPDTWESLMKVPKLLKDCTKTFCVSEWALGEDPKKPTEIQEKIKEDAGESAEWWSYICMGPGSPHPNWHLQMSGGQHRAVAWRTWREGAKGLLYWGANCYNVSEGNQEAISPITWREGLPPGDGVLLYPGERYGAGSVPVASVRLERALIGLQDVEYLNQHSALYGRKASVEVMTKTAYKGPREFSQNWSDAEQLKAILADRIVKGNGIVQGMSDAGPEADRSSASKTPSIPEEAPEPAEAAAAAAKLRG